MSLIPHPLIGPGWIIIIRTGKKKKEKADQKQDNENDIGFLSVHTLKKMNFLKIISIYYMFQKCYFLIKEDNSEHEWSESDHHHQWNREKSNFVQSDWPYQSNVKGSLKKIILLRVTLIYFRQFLMR